MTLPARCGVRDRDDLVRSIAEAAESTRRVLALWEEGSVAFGRADEYSDVDFAAIVAAGEVDVVLIGCASF